MTDETIKGTPSNDELRGDDGMDVIYAYGGDDDIEGGKGDDTIYAGSGDDCVDGGSGNDTIYGEGGNDTLEGGKGDDVIYGGDGRDEISGGSGDDTLYGGAGRDDISGGSGDDTAFGGSGMDEIEGGKGDDKLYGGDNNDVIYGGSGNDVLAGGQGADVLIGGKGDDILCGDGGDDVLIGGSGNDTLYGGEGNDVMVGGKGGDTFYASGGGNDTVIGDGSGFGSGSGKTYHEYSSAHGTGTTSHEDAHASGDHHYDSAAHSSGGATGSGKNDDILYVEGDVRIELSDGNVIEAKAGDIINLRADGENDDDGKIYLSDGSTVTFDEIEEIRVVNNIDDPDVCICFTPGTMIATPTGERPVEELREGDRVITRDNGIREISWAGRKPLTRQTMLEQPNLRPVLIRAGSLGDNLPERDMMVSPNHRMLIANERTSLYFEEHEVLVAAKHLMKVPGIERAKVEDTAYVHIMFEQHEVVLANGAWTESFQPGDYSLNGLGRSQREEIFTLFPELREDAGIEGYIAARPTLKRNEAAVLFGR
ncbi:hypothetical protein BV394_08680 [Brevirhabdus pacifica]|uniref:Hedgehog/Intein (Hint) domain-containing protein n=1 Tax=Brevirhabdus pacifica TaxID=1267768 RepID=A0A1U7DIF2_9RHOB|nr:Hint domain-containing protein [Brevirhabdus pacifica]APX89780.1 hypothetical protein BV394_08680 [Brevirhabdus pacifica]PJJ83016.1 intein [Brevirhabdus pacifica]